MPGINYIPAGDDAFKAWALNFSTLITATPTAFGLVAGQATAYAALYATYNTSLAAATDPTTRTTVTVAAKDSARASLQANSRLLAGIVQAFPGITPTQLASLGLTVRATTRPPIPAPTTAPIMSIIGNSVLASTLRYSDANTPDSRAKPFGAISLRLYVKYGTVPPVSVADCTLLATVTRNPVNIDWPAAQTGSTAHLIGVWQTRRGLTGPPSPIVSTVVIGH